MLTKNDLTQIRNVIKEEVRLETKPIRKDLKTLKKKVTKIEKTVDVMIDQFNRDDMRLNKRVKKIETHLGLPA